MKFSAETWLFRIHRLIPSADITADQPLEIPVTFNVELWFGESGSEEQGK